MLTNPVTDSGSVFTVPSSLPAFEDYNPEAADDFNNDDDTSLFSDDQREDHGARDDKIDGPPDTEDSTKTHAQKPSKKRKERDRPDVTTILAPGSKRSSPKTTIMVEDDENKENKRVERDETLAKQALALKKKT